MKMIYIDLVMDNGNLVRITCPAKYEDECRETLEHELKVGGFWSPHRWDHCTAEYLGHRLDRVNMSRVIGGM